tara:strand:+ start:2024 stop:2737 length:714 start_codon:yes stop_codon:yes gene_type:complete
MTFKHQKYMRMTPNDMHNAMMKQRMTPLEMEHIKQIVIEQKLQIKRDAARKVQHDILWRELWQPLAYELRIARSILGYTEKSYAVPERKKAITEYIRVLEKSLTKLKTAHKAYTHTPKQLAQEASLPNDGIHWTDWIPLSVRSKVEVLFDAIPARFKAKVKTPFTRSIPAEQNDKLRAKLRARTEKDLDAAIQVAAIDAEKHPQIERIRKALDVIDAMEDHEPVPRSWQGLFQNGSA